MPEKKYIFEEFKDKVSDYYSKDAILYETNDEYKGITYSQLFEKALKLGNLLKSRGIKASDTVGLIFENHPEFAYGFFAAMSIDATVTPLDIQYSGQYIRSLLLHAKAKILLTNEKTYHRIKDDLEDFDIIALDSAEFEKNFDEYSFKFETEEKPLSNDLAVLFFTSGTTDIPKAVMLTHDNLLSNVDAIKQLNLLTDKDIMVSILPLHHTYAFTTSFLAPILSGASIVFPPSISSVGLLSAIGRTQATILVGVPQIFSLMYRSINEKIKSISGSKQLALKTASNLTNLASSLSGTNLNKKLFKELHHTFGEQFRFMVSGGARLDPEVAIAFKLWGFQLLEGYGLTETSPLATFNRPNAQKIGSVGKPVAGVSINIVNPDEKGIGEVTIKGPNVMAGYYHMPEQTAEIIKDGWFHTGDLGYIDKDGFLFLIGRKKEIIVLSSGKNINPEEVEKHYNQSPFIKECCVLSTKEGMDYLKGVEHLAAVIHIDEDYFKASNEPNIRQRLKWEIENYSTKLPTYKKIRGFTISTKPLPRTRLGKLKRFEIDKIYIHLLKSSNERPEEPRPEAEASAPKIQYSHFSQIALNFLSKTLQRDVHVEDHLELDLGLDSLGRVELLLGLQNALNLDLSDEEAMQFFMNNTVNDLLIELKKFMPRISQEVKDEHLPVWGKILTEEPPEGIKENIEFNITFTQVISIILILFIKLTFKLFFWLKVEGKENLKQKGPYLICPNHVSYLDALIVLSALPINTLYNTFFVGYNQIFKKFRLKSFTKMARLIPIETSYSLVDALKTCSYVLMNSKIVCYFPEGQRSIDGEVQEFKNGVGILMKEINTPIVPVYIDGAFEAWPRFNKLPKLHKIHIRFGKMLTIKDLLDNAPHSESESYKIIAQNLQKHVKQLKKT